MAHAVYLSLLGIYGRPCLSRDEGTNMTTSMLDELMQGAAAAICNAVQQAAWQELCLPMSMPMGVFYSQELQYILQQAFMVL